MRHRFFCRFKENVGKEKAGKLCREIGGSRFCIECAAFYFARVLAAAFVTEFFNRVFHGVCNKFVSPRC